MFNNDQPCKFIVKIPKKGYKNTFFLDMTQNLMGIWLLFYAISQTGMGMFNYDQV